MATPATFGTMAALALYHDFTSPFCRLAFAAASRAAADAGIELALHPFELRPAPLPLPPDALDAVAAEVEAAADLAAAWELELRLPERIPRTGKAHEAVAFAAGRGQTAALALATAIYHACWSGGADIGRIDVLADIGAAAGEDREALHVALGLDQLREAVEAAQREAERAGVAAVPMLRHGDRWLAGVVAPGAIGTWLAGAD